MLNYIYPAPGREAEYCDACLSVCLSVRKHIPKTFSVRMLPMAESQSFSGAVAIRYALPVCG